MKFTFCLTALGENAYRNEKDLSREIDKVVPFFKNMESDKVLFALSCEDSCITIKIAIFINNMNEERESALGL